MRIIMVAQTEIVICCCLLNIWVLVHTGNISPCPGMHIRDRLSPKYVTGDSVVVVTNKPLVSFELACILHSDHVNSMGPCLWYLCA